MTTLCVMTPSTFGQQMTAVTMGVTVALSGDQPSANSFSQGLKLRPMCSMLARRSHGGGQPYSLMYART